MSQTKEDVGTTSPEQKHLSPIRDLQRGEQASSPLPQGFSQDRALIQKDGQALLPQLPRKRYMLSPYQKGIQKCGARGVEHAAQSQVLELGGGWKCSQTPISPLFPLSSFQPRHIGLSGLVFRGACGLKGQPKHLTSAVWIAQLG